MFGDLVTMTAHIDNIEVVPPEYPLSYHWRVMKLPGSEVWEDLPRGDGMTYAFHIDMINSNWMWQFEVIVHDPRYI